MTSPEFDHAANGLAEVGVREIKAQTRILRSQLVQRLGRGIHEKDALTSWIPRHAANVCPGADWWTTVARLISGDVARFGNAQWRNLGGQCISDQLVRTRQCEADHRMLRGVFVRDHERSGAAIFLTPDGVKKENENCDNVGAREMGSRVHRNVCWSSFSRFS